MFVRRGLELLQDVNRFERPQFHSQKIGGAACEFGRQGPIRSPCVVETPAHTRNERFLYEYDFVDGWEHQVRMERFIPQAPLYPKCIAGSRAAPPEDCGGPIAFEQRRDAAPWEARDLLHQIADCVDKRDLTALEDRIDEIGAVQEWLLTDQFDRRNVNRRLRQYATGNEEWQWD